MADSRPNSGDVFEVDRIRSLIELMKEFDLSEIDLREAQQRIRLCREGETVVAAPVSPVAGASRPAAVPAEAEDENITVIKSPMVGTFYIRANPNSDPYIRVGDLVEPDTTICIIEAMKVFNEIPAEVKGRIVAVLADDEDPVEYGKPLFKVDTGGS